MLGLPPKRTGMQTVIMEEAVRNPKGVVGLSLKYGKTKAKKMVLERHRRRIGLLTVHERKRRRKH
jgi:hypothetical protein